MWPFTKAVEERRSIPIWKGSVALEPGETLMIPFTSSKDTNQLKPFTITSTVKLEATDARAAILKASQLLAEVTHGTLYEFEEFSVKVE